MSWIRPNRIITDPPQTNRALYDNAIMVKSVGSTVETPPYQPSLKHRSIRCESRTYIITAIITEALIKQQITVKLVQFFLSLAKVESPVPLPLKTQGRRYVFVVVVWGGGQKSISVISKIHWSMSLFFALLLYTCLYVVIFKLFFGWQNIPCPRFLRPWNVGVFLQHVKRMAIAFIGPFCVRSIQGTFDVPSTFYSPQGHLALNVSEGGRSGLLYSKRYSFKGESEIWSTIDHTKSQ